jgi:hypothetical protein
MFPEGTDRTDHTLRRSRDYAKKHGLKELKNVLYPRSAGFIYMVNEMRRSKLRKNELFRLIFRKIYSLCIRCYSSVSKRDCSKRDRYDIKRAFIAKRSL